MLSFAVTADNVSINVYLKLKPDNQVDKLINEFNQFLEQHHILSRYQIKPYLNQHPLHITLYMTNYKAQQIPLIIKQAKALASQYHPITLLTSEFIANNSGYVMLPVAQEVRIQKLSNQALHALASLRDKNALIPDWAAQDKGRQLVFSQYGSPNVLNYFNPHFSVFTAENLDKEERTQLYAQLQQLIRQFAQSHSTQVKANAYSIGVGIADAQGQIVKELNAFDLAQTELPSSSAKRRTSRIWHRAI